MAVIGRTGTRDLHPGDGRPDLSYVPALDGVRGVAVLAIMGYHGGVFLTSGGFYSLDAFFALSGFLITSLLVAQWQQSGSIRLGRFWARRARRLLPALFVLLPAVLAYATWVAPPGMYPGLRGDSLSTLLYVANWHFIVTGSNYFAQTGATSPLLHTWSLAVEEQFYLVWPLIVLLILRSRLGLRILFGVCVGGAIASAVLMAILASPSTQNRVYYGTDTRAQSLLVDAALSVALTIAANRRRSAGRGGTGPVGQSKSGSRSLARATSRRSIFIG
jgi:peptidoglycan/LPS O-acetylase OafA/YrhL